MADTPEASDFTSIQQRIRALARKGHEHESPACEGDEPRLTVLGREGDDPHANAVAFTTEDYLELVDWTGRAIREDKRGAIPESIPPILDRLRIDPVHFLRHVGGGAEVVPCSGPGPRGAFSRGGETARPSKHQGCGDIGPDVSGASRLSLNQRGFRGGADGDGVQEWTLPLLLVQPLAGRAAVCACGPRKVLGQVLVAPCGTGAEYGVPAHELRRIREVVEGRQPERLEAWNEFFGHERG